MPPRRVVSPEEAAIDTIAREIEEISEALAAKYGPAPDADPVSDARQLAQWGQRDPRIGDPEGFKMQLMQTGLKATPELMDPNNAAGLAIFEAHPDLTEMYSEPVDEELADMLVRMAEYPFRLGMLASYEDDPEGAVEFAERMDKRWQGVLGPSPSRDGPTQDVYATPARQAEPDDWQDWSY